MTNIKLDREQSKQVLTKASDIVHSVLRLMDDPRPAKTALYIARKLPPEAVPTISKVAIKRLKSAKDNVTPAFFQPFIELIVDWQWISNFSELLTNWFGKSLEADQDLKNPTPVVGQRLRFNIPEETPRPYLAIKYTNFILESQYISRELTVTNLLEDLRIAIQPILMVFKSKLFTEEKKTFKHLDNYGEKIFLEYLKLFFRLAIFSDLSSADEVWSEKARRTSITPKKSRTPHKSDNSFFSVNLALKWVKLVGLSDQVREDTADLWNKCMRLTIEFFGNILAVDQSIVSDKVKGQVLTYSKALLRNEKLKVGKESLIKIIMQADTFNIGYIVDGFTKEHDFSLDLLRPSIANLMIKFINMVSFFTLVVIFGCFCLKNITQKPFYWLTMFY